MYNENISHSYIHRLPAFYESSSRSAADQQQSQVAWNHPEEASSILKSRIERNAWKQTALFTAN